MYVYLLMQTPELIGVAMVATRDVRTRTITIHTVA